MALIDEYKQAIQDVLDGRMKEAPRPSELPWTEDKAATMWAAAAAELIAEDSAGGGGGGADEFVITFASASAGTASDVTQGEIYAAASSGKQMVLMVAGVREPVLSFTLGSVPGSGKYCENILSEKHKIATANEGSSSKATLYSRPSGAFIASDSSGTLNKTYSEIYAAFTDGQPVLISGGSYPNSYRVSVVACYYEYGTGNVVATNGAGPIAETYIAAGQNDYPVAQS